MMVIRPLKQLAVDLLQAFRDWQADDGYLMAGAVAYYASLSFFPLLLLLLAGVGTFLRWTPIGHDAEHDLLEAIGTLTSPQLQQQISELLVSVHSHAKFGGPLGIAGLCLGAIVLFAQFERAFDRIWNTPPRASSGLVEAVKNILIFRLRAFLMLVVLGATLIVVFIAGMTVAAVQAMTDVILSSDSWLWWLAQIVLSVSINSLVLAAMFKWLPKTDVNGRDALAGGLLTAIAWETGRVLLAALVIGGRFSSAYGIIGSFIGVMLWFYYAGAIIFLGAEYVQVLRARRKQLSNKTN